MFEQKIVVGPFQCNCRLLVCSRTGEAVLIDPGDEAEKIRSALRTATTPTGIAIQLKYLLHTHGHLDHIGATRALKEKGFAQREAPSQPSPKIALHRDDEPLYQQLQMQGQLFGMTYENPLPIDHYLEDSEELQVGDLHFSVLHTPGHSPGSVSLRLHEKKESQIIETVYSGDTLFQNSVGRTDLWGGDSDLMFKNIRQRLLTLDDDTRVCPGHGSDSKIGLEKRQNPFLQ